MKTVYLNMKSSYGTETVDQISREDFATRAEYVKELRSMIANYHLVGMAVYTSRRCTNDWKNN
jgi:hypothetical protein